MVQTRFYYDIQDADHFVILHHSKKILLASDIDRGYVLRRWVINRFKNAIQPLRLTRRSCLVEYLVKSIGAIPIEKHRVFVS